MKLPKPNRILAGMIVFLCALNSLDAQKQTNYWFFGIFAGLDFSAGSPKDTSGALNTTEGCSSISDSLGNLLFYTDGVSVWNRTHTTMPNGTGLNGDVSTTQSALIVKKPGSIKDYFIFTLPAEGIGNFCYSMVDMTLDGGNGDVTTKNTILKGNVTEKMSAVHHCNGKDIWVTVHELGNNAYYSYKVTAAGVSTPVVSNAGRVHTGVHGQMKFNNNGTKIACVRDSVISTGPPPVAKAFLDIMNFNNQTGVVTYSLTIPLNNWQKSYGVEFSPDNTKLYATYYDVTGVNGGNSELIQFNLAAANIAASGVTVGASFDPNILRSLQVARDGKIYLSKSNTPFVCVIHAPNGLGAACSYSDNAINVDSNSVGNGCMLGLPGFVQSYFHPNFPDIATCNTNTVTPPQPTVNTSVAEHQPARFSFFYDAQSGELIATFEPGAQANLVVASITGQVLVRTIKPSGDDIVRISLSALPKGFYIVTCEMEGVLTRQKFVVAGR
jgi:hypothetical protein